MDEGTAERVNVCAGAVPVLTVMLYRAVPFTGLFVRGRAALLIVVPVPL